MVEIVDPSVFVVPEAVLKLSVLVGYLASAVSVLAVAVLVLSLVNVWKERLRAARRKR